MFVALALGRLKQEDGEFEASLRLETLPQRKKTTSPKHNTTMFAYINIMY
jgi:hypothetical protein